jgi:hypothetical protein
VSSLTPLLTASIAFAYLGGTAFVGTGVYLSVRNRRLHPLLLVCIGAISTSWIEAPYDWAVYAQFPPAIPRMPSWWPLNKTWGGLPSSVPVGYIAYFLVPAFLGAHLGRRLIARYGWNPPRALLAVGMAVGCCWAFVFNAILGARLGVFYYGRVIPHLALWPGTKHQYPLYDSLAMGIQMMLFTYLLGRVDAHGRTPVERWAAARSGTRRGATLYAVAAIVVIANLAYLAVFTPHLVTKVLHQQTVTPPGQLFHGVANQPL